MTIDLFRRHAGTVKALFPDIQERRLILETVRRMINELITDVTETSRANIERARPGSLEDVRAQLPLITFSPRIREEAVKMKRFLHKELYHHYLVQRMTNKARRIVNELFGLFLSQPILLPTEHFNRTQHLGTRAIADYVAGMTDRYAIREYVRLFTMGELLSS